MHRSALLHIGIALLLLFAQAASAAHGYSHLTETGTTSGQPDKQLPHAAACEHCLAAAALGGAMPATALAFAAVVSHPFVIVHASASFHSGPVPAYASRAPPRFV